MSTRRGLFALLFGLFSVALPGIAAAQDPSFFVTNRSGRTINEVYVSSSNVNSWGSDLLGANVLPSGNRLPVRPGQCVNDIRVVYDNGQAEERRRINTCNLNEVVFGQAAAGTGQALQGADFRIVNRSNRTINEIYVSSSQNNNWGTDWLGQTTLAPGRFWTIRPREGQCLHDIRVVFAGGDIFERRRVDTCQITEFTIQ